MFKKILDKIKKFYKDHKKQILIAGVVLGFMLATLAIFMFMKSDTVERTDPNSTGQSTVPEIVLVPSPLTGREVTSDLAKFSTIGIIIENSPDARPQSGMDSAGVVWEAVAEGGITRFQTIHQEEMADKIGPVRSLRTYHLDMGMGFDAGIAHVGGDPKALAEFRSLGGRDLDQFVNSGSYWRSTDRYAPHNVYTSGKFMRDLMTAKGFTTSEFGIWERKPDAPLEIPTAGKIAIEPSSFLYHVDYAYTPTTNTYNRSMADQLHKDKETAKVLSPNVVIVMKARHAIIDSAGRYEITLTGTGEAWIFQDGGVVKGTWKKANRTSNVSFVDSEGKAIKLNAGQTWVTIIPTDRAVVYSP